MQDSSWERKPGRRPEATPGRGFCSSQPQKTTCLGAVVATSGHEGHTRPLGVWAGLGADTATGIKACSPASSLNKGKVVTDGKCQKPATDSFEACRVELDPVTECLPQRATSPFVVVFTLAGGPLGRTG